jgi:hypothetical protein
MTACLKCSQCVEEVILLQELLNESNNTKATHENKNVKRGVRVWVDACPRDFSPKQQAIA